MKFYVTNNLSRARVHMIQANFQFTFSYDYNLNKNWTRTDYNGDVRTVDKIASDIMGDLRGELGFIVKIYDVMRILMGFSFIFVFIMAVQYRLVLVYFLSDYLFLRLFQT